MSDSKHPVSAKQTAAEGPAHFTTIIIEKEYLHFGAAHFTVFSSDNREDLHGHNFYIACEVDARIFDDGLAFDYNDIKKVLAKLCEKLDEKVLMASDSPHLTFNERDGYIWVGFADEQIPFLPRDVLMLPIRNITVEELARWFLEQTLSEFDAAAAGVTALRMRASSGPGQWAQASWEAK